MSNRYNIRASFNKLVASVADAGVPVLFEEHEPWKAPCYRVEWIASDIPRDATRFQRLVRVHVRDTSTAAAEDRIDRLLDALGLGNNLTLTPQPVYDWRGYPQGNPPPQIGTYLIERSARGVDEVPNSPAEPAVSHRIATLVVVYDHELH